MSSANESVEKVLLKVLPFSMGTDFLSSIREFHSGFSCLYIFKLSLP
jgi:hypothetical protein